MLQLCPWKPSFLVCRPLGCFLAVFCISICLSQTLSAAARHAEGLQTCSIYRLDVAQEFESALPKCEVENLASCYLQQLYEPSDRRIHGRRLEPHYLSQYSQTRWIVEGLKSAGVLVDTAEKADAIFVDDYCYSSFFIAKLHSEGHAEDAPFSPYSTMMDLNKAISELPMYQATQGRKFTVPFSHVWLPPWLSDLMCVGLHGALHMTLEATHCYACPPEFRPEQLVIPFPSPAWPRQEEQILPANRPQLLFFIGACLENGELNLDVPAGHEGHGKLMRHMIVHHLLGNQPVNVRALLSCIKRLPHAEIRKEISSSKFCLLPPGDSVSSRRLTDIILGGCIPVFVGPPYHNTPFSNYLDYTAVGIFLNVMEFRNLTGTKGSSSEHLQTPHQLPSGQAQDLFDVDWWIPTLDFSDHSISLGLDDIWTYLQAIPEDVVEAKLQKVQEARPFFDYASLALPQQSGYSGSGPNQATPSIIDVVIDAMCRHSATESS